jgi:release factor glutamine methyltransferase
MIDFLSYKKELLTIFKKNNIDTNEVNIIFCEALNLSRTDLINLTKLSLCQKLKVQKATKKRLKGKPVQKIFGRAYFYGLTFKINNNVLCPRPETELLVEEALKFVSPKNSATFSAIESNLGKNQTNKTVLDLCTGSGAIAISLAKNSNAKVFATDISSKALCVARRNAKIHNAKIEFSKSDMFKNITKKFDVIVSNPPYIPNADIEKLDVEVKKYDPIISLAGGVDGLDFYKIIAQNAKNHLTQNGKILVEVGMGQAEIVKNLFEKNGFDCYVKKDYNNIERIVVGELK